MVVPVVASTQWWREINESGGRLMAGFIAPSLEKQGTGKAATVGAVTVNRKGAWFGGAALSLVATPRASVVVGAGPLYDTRVVSFLDVVVGDSGVCYCDCVSGQCLLLSLSL